MNFDLKLGKAASVLFLALAMAGCGGGGSTTTTPPVQVPDPAIAERAAIDTAIGAARTAVAAVTDTATDAQVSAADTAIANARSAITAATNVPSEETNANSETVDVIAAALTSAKASRTKAMNDAAAAAKKAMNAMGKSMYAALGPPKAPAKTALDNIVAFTSTTGLQPKGLVIHAASGAGALGDGTPGTTEVIPDPVTLTAGASAGSLGGWMGTNYAHTNPVTKVMNEAVVYTNQGSPKTTPFAAEYTIATEKGEGALKGYYTLDVVGTPNDFALVKATVFTHSGTQTHVPASGADDVRIRGTFAGAPGEYLCDSGGAEQCQSENDGKGSPTSLSGSWYFKPDVGAMVSQARCQLPVFRMVGEQRQGRHAHGGQRICKHCRRRGRRWRRQRDEIRPRTGRLGNLCRQGHRKVRHEQSTDRRRRWWQLHGGCRPDHQVRSRHPFGRQ